MIRQKLEVTVLLALVATISMTVFYLYSAEEITVAPKEKTTISISQTEIDLGSIEQGMPKEVMFTLTNIGSAPLVIYDVETTCGCTGAEWPKKPIKANEEGEIKVTYDAKDLGKFIKTITVYGNLENGSKMLQIRGVVKSL